MEYGRDQQQQGFGYPPQQHPPQQQGYGQQERHHASGIVHGQVVRIFCKAKPDFYLTETDDGNIVMSQGNVSDQRQQWIKDDTWGEKLTDSQGAKAFALVNKTTGRALRHGNSENELVIQSGYSKNDMEDDLLWTASADLGHGFHTIRTYNNIDLNLDVDHGDKKHGGVKEGNKLILFKWCKDHDNQYWKIVPV